MPQRVGVLAELRELVPVARERVESGGERSVVGQVIAVGIAERLEARLLLRRPVRHRKGGDVPLHRVPDPLQQRQHRARPADAVQPHYGGAGVLEALTGVLGRPSVPRLGLLVDRERDHRGHSCLFDDVERHQCLLTPRERLADHEVDACLDRPADLLFEHRPDR